MNSVCLKTRDFRRTLARFIARHLGGVVIRALRYRHHSIQMLESSPNPRGLRQQDPSRALFRLATELSAVILARFFGIHIKVAVQWQNVSSRRLGRSSIA